MIALFQKKNHSSSSFILNLQKNIKNIIYYEFNDTSFGIICIDKLIYKFDQSHDFFWKIWNIPAFINNKKGAETSDYMHEEHSPNTA